MLTADWEQAARAAAELLGIPDSELPPYPEPVSSLSEAPEGAAEGAEGGKRKSPEPEGDEEEEEKGKGGKKKRGKKGKKAQVPPPPPPGGPPAQQQQQAVAASFLGVFDPRSLATPAMPDTEAMGKILLERRKEAVRAQYGV